MNFNASLVTLDLRWGKGVSNPTQPKTSCMTSVLSLPQVEGFLWNKSKIRAVH